MSLKALLSPILSQVPAVSQDHEIEVLQELPVESLFFALKAADAESAVWVYEHAELRQVQGLIDADCWRGPEFLPQRFLNHFKCMTALHPTRIAELSTGLDAEVMVRFLLEHVAVLDFDPQNPPEVSESLFMLSPDNKYALILQTQDPEIREALRIWMNKLSASNLEGLRRLLEACKWEQSSDLEEHGYQMAKGRLEELGFVDRLSALELFSVGKSASALKTELLENPLDATSKTSALPADNEDNERVGNLLPTTINQSLEGEAFFRQAFAQIQDPGAREMLRMETLRVVNGFLAADDLMHKDLEDLKDPIARARRYLSLGLEYLSDGSESKAPDLLRTQPLWKIARLGWLVIQDLARAAKELQQSAAFLWLEESDREWIVSLCGRHPQRMADVSSIKSVLELGKQLLLMKQLHDFLLKDLAAVVDAEKNPLDEKDSALSRLLTTIFREACGAEPIMGPMSLSELEKLSSAVSWEKLGGSIRAVSAKAPPALQAMVLGRLNDKASDLKFALEHLKTKKPDPRFFQALSLERGKKA